MNMMDFMTQEMGIEDPVKEADQWLRNHKDRPKEEHGFLIAMLYQDEEVFFEIMDALEMISECDQSLSGNCELTENVRMMVEITMRLYIEDITEYYLAYRVIKEIRGAKAEGVTTGVSEVLKFYNAMQVLNKEEPITFGDNVWKEFEEAEKRMKGEN